MLNTIACSTQQSPSRSSGIACSHKRGKKTTETTPMKDLSNFGDGRIGITNERVLEIAREYGCHFSRVSKRYILLNSTHFIKLRIFKS
jgi:hypothetical protein